MINGKTLLIAEARGVEKRGPIDAWRISLQLGARPHAGVVRPVVALLAGIVRARDARLQVEDALGARLCVGIARKRQQLLDVGAILAADGGHVGLAREIVFALRQAQSA